MNSGAIKFSENIWRSMPIPQAVELMVWLDKNLEPGYQIIMTGHEYCYFVGSSNQLFNKESLNQSFDVYNLQITDNSFSTVADEHIKLSL